MFSSFLWISKAVQSGALLRRQIAVPFIALNLFTVSFLLWPVSAFGDTFLTAGPTAFGDDQHTSTLTPYANNNPIPISTIVYPNSPINNGQCTWINAGLDAFIAGNKNPNVIWSYSWAGIDQEAKVEAAMNVLDYFPFVVNAPKVIAADGSVFAERPKGELGGAVLNLSYTPTAANGAPILADPTLNTATTTTTMQWIQAYSGTIYGNAFGPILDNNPDDPYGSQKNNTIATNNFTPFYGPNGPYAGGVYGDKSQNAWFEDRPQVPEKEYETNPVVTAQFQVVLATDTVTVNGGKTSNVITLYGGEWWGFTYSANDIPAPVPEPSSFILLGLGGLALTFRACRRRQLAA